MFLCIFDHFDLIKREKADQIEKNVQEVTDSLDETKDLISDINNTKVKIQKSFNGTEDDISEVNTPFPFHSFSEILLLFMTFLL